MSRNEQIYIQTNKYMNIWTNIKQPGRNETSIKGNNTELREDEGCVWTTKDK